jgi:hypothetical protein
MLPMIRIRANPKPVTTAAVTSFDRADITIAMLPGDL